MSRIPSGQLNVRKIESLKDGIYGDGGNLYITIKGNARHWTVRYLSPTTCKRREIGIGSAYVVTLARARQMAVEIRRQVADCIDPLELRAKEKRNSLIPFFAVVAERYIEEQTPGWRDPRSGSIWRSSLSRLAYPFIGDKSVASINTDNILEVLRPIWTEKTETADRVRGRIERILDYAATHGWRYGDNPARWRGHLSNILPKPSSVAKVKHHAALEWQKIGEVMQKLDLSDSVSSLAVQLLCLCAVRSSEVRKARWDEVDEVNAIWVIPSERMKTGKEHRIPLSDRAVTILRQARVLQRTETDLIFPGQKKGQPLTDVALSKALHYAAGTKEVTIHGLRSTFRDWCGEATSWPRDVAEMALAHTIANKVEAAYRRGDLFAKRREMMQQWADFCFDMKQGKTTNG